MIVLLLLLTGFFILIHQFLWFFTVKDFQISKKENIFICLFLLFSLIAWKYFDFPVNNKVVVGFLISTTMMNLSIADIKYYEISGKSYYFFIVPILILFAFNLQDVMQYLISLLIITSVFFLTDKIIGLGIGGADIKLMMILSLTISLFDVLTFMLLSFVFVIVIFLIKYLFKVIQTKKIKIKDLKIPMILAIYCSWMIMYSLSL